MIKRIAIYCASTCGQNPLYSQAAAHLASLLAEKQIDIIYGGTNVGIMEVIAKAALQKGGRVIGIIPHDILHAGLGHEKLSEMIITKTIAERKAKMIELSDAMIALPGSFGTMDELFTSLVLSQLGFHDKAIGLLNTGGFYQSLIALLDTMRKEGFLKECNYQRLIVASTPEDLIEKIGCSPALRE